MSRRHRSFLGCVLLPILVPLIASGQRSNAPLSANDVSWLFPPPRTVKDLDNLIAIRDLSTGNLQDPTKREPVWSNEVFQQFVEIAGSQATQIPGTGNRIQLPADAQSIDAWYIAGVRIDAGAPGLSPKIVAQFGRSPEIRLIVQPVTRNPDRSVTVNDIAGHLILGEHPKTGHT